MKFAIIQFNPFIGDIEGNQQRILHLYQTALSQKAQCVIFPEMALLGYPPMDMLFHDSVKRAVHNVINTLKNQVTFPLILGAPLYFPPFASFSVPFPIKGGKLRRGIYNCLLVLKNGELVKVVAKSLLPNYDVFDERRYFLPGPEKQDRVLDLDGIKIGLSICEDLWFEKHENHFDYDFDPRASLQGCDLILNISASPYHRYKQIIREKLLIESTKILKSPIIYVNQVGGMEEILFDGFSSVCSSDGFWAVPPFCFEEKILEWEYPSSFSHQWKSTIQTPLSTEPFLQFSTKKEILKMMDEFSTEDNQLEKIYHILLMGIRDFFRKQGFKKAVIGLSGGIDSALVATLATRALGSDKVLGITMPSAFSSLDSSLDSIALAQNLEIEIKTLPIEDNVVTILNSLGTSFSKSKISIAEENIQARIRGLLLMAFSNKLSHLLLATSNKSELAVGYSTLYGDMNGALAIIGDLYKTEVNALAKWINKQKEIIPQNILDKPPSAELRPGQKDSDSLPEYEVLDKILIDSIEFLLTTRQIAQKHHLDFALVQDIQKKIHLNEHKRFQSPPILRVSPKAFGRGRRYPLVKSSKYLF